jgi:hypothetical protein
MMDSPGLFTAFFGWCSVINIALLLLATVFISAFNRFTKTIHAKMFHVSMTELDIIYFSYLAYYKLGILIFNIVPYVALKLMALSMT